MLFSIVVNNVFHSFAVQLFQTVPIVLDLEWFHVVELEETIYRSKVAKHVLMFLFGSCASWGFLFEKVSHSVRLHLLFSQINGKILSWTRPNRWKTDFSILFTKDSNCFYLVCKEDSDAWLRLEEMNLERKSLGVDIHHPVLAFFEQSMVCSVWKLMVTVCARIVPKDGLYCIRLKTIPSPDYELVFKVGNNLPHEIRSVDGTFRSSSLYMGDSSLEHQTCFWKGCSGGWLSSRITFSLALKLTNPTFLEGSILFDYGKLQQLSVSVLDFVSQ